MKLQHTKTLAPPLNVCEEHNCLVKSKSIWQWGNVKYLDAHTGCYTISYVHVNELWR